MGKFVLQDEEPQVVQEEEVPVEEEALVVTVGEEEDGEEAEEEHHAPGWVKEVRKRNRELEREVRDLRKQTQVVPIVEVALGPKPTLEAHDYDTIKYEESLTSWFELKRKADEKAHIVKKAEETAETVWKNKLSALEKAKVELAADDYDDAESVVLGTLDTVQQGIIVHGAKNAALLVYALGKNETAIKKLAAIKDPVEFAFAVARLEAQMKVSSKKPATQPEERVISTARPSGADTNLERLRAQAEKTGDYTQVRAYKDKLKARK